VCPRKAIPCIWLPNSMFPALLPELMVVGGGKGGVGKTCFSVNLAVEIARRGWRVVLVDADLSCSNVEAMLGVTAGPASTTTSIPSPRAP
jgi:Mrp family chromosome partitioning ATPase